MNEALISVIIPVYNLEDYISKCLDSVLAQTYSDFEIIAVDDGSTDGSAKILQEYSKKDGRIKPLLKENGGVSSARNAGINHAKGQYVFFLDGDDWLEPNALEKLITDNLDFDIIQGAYINSYDNSDDQTSVNFVKKQLFDRNEMLKSYYLNEIQESCCNKLYKKSVIGDTRFDETMAVAEDSKFIYALLKKAETVKLITDITYHYYIREDSCMHSQLSKKNFLTLTLRDQQMTEAKSNREIFKKFIYKYSYDVFHIIKGILHDNTHTYDDQLSGLRLRILDIKKLIFSSADISLKFKAGVLMLWLFPSIFYKLYKKNYEYTNN